MSSQAYSLREAINILKQHRNKMETQIGKSKVERLLFNLEEINLDIESIASQLVDVSTEQEGLEQLPEIFDSFQQNRGNLRPQLTRFPQPLGKDERQ